MTPTKTRTVMTVQRQADGWQIEAVPEDQPDHAFTAFLNLCDCTGEKVKISGPCGPHDGLTPEGRPGVPCVCGSYSCRQPKRHGGYHLPHVKAFVKRIAATYADCDVPEVTR